ncbi:MAG: FAD-binding domain-containing protein [Flavobacteriales bacterium]
MQQTKINIKQQDIKTLSFSTQIDVIKKLAKSIQPVRYASSRNYKNGAVSKLGPYISRGVLSTKILCDEIKATGVSFAKAEKFIQELAWRDYWQQVWVAKGDLIFSDLKRKQEQVESYQIPEAIVDACTGVEAIDEGIKALYQSGYMHNHMRMYVASIACNIARCHWSLPSKWMYYNLLDGDLASNILSWQWVVGSNSGKKYYANQSNINNFFESNQRNTYLDCSYESFEDLAIPTELKHTLTLNLETNLDNIPSDNIEPNRPTLIYNYYNLDPHWHQNEDYQRVILLEPWLFEKFPVSQACIDFLLNLSKNIEDVKFYVGDFKSLKQKIENGSIVYKEHPLNTHYIGIEENRDWLSSVTGYHKSFFSFWKYCKKEVVW